LWGDTAYVDIEPFICIVVLFSRICLGDSMAGDKDLPRERGRGDTGISGRSVFYIVNISFIDMVSLVFYLRENIYFYVGSAWRRCLRNSCFGFVEKGVIFAVAYMCRIFLLAFLRVCGKSYGVVEKLTRFEFVYKNNY
jgi:hypothetical protein